MPSHPPPGDDDLPLREQVKRELRKRMRGLRAAMPASACAHRSSQIVERLLSLEPLAAAKTVALFFPIVEKKEVDLRPFDLALRSRGVRVAYPKVDETTGALLFRFVEDPARMAPGPFGVMEPDDSAPPASIDRLDAIVVPALAVDTRGHRLGYGRGFYDRALGRCRATSIAVAFHFQLVPEISNVPFDVPVQWIVTDQEVFAARAGEEGDSTGGRG